MPRRVVRAALTETSNAYAHMPETVEELGSLKDKLEDIRKANVEHHIELMEAARAQGVQVICFGELFPAPYFALGTDPMWIPLAEDARTGKTVTELREAARRLGLIVVAPIYERDGEKRFNTAVVLDEKGEYLGKFRKAHIPFGGNEQGSFHENFYYGRSDSDPLFPVFATSVGKIGVAICYDRHFYYVMPSLARQGAELIFSPAITFGSKSQRMWHLEFPTDAARFNVFIGGSNRKGSEKPWNQPYFGESYFVGPNGLCANLSTHPNLVIADIDLTTLSEPDPSGWNLPRDTRKECSVSG
ncbi:MAG: acyltransferase [Candidatus Eremiobacteraeota bacterium]|nr:acyltransferase [Candidatus Eremiobacteraeota bacterium]MCW5866588.1 acyltransferase [Candidatus Eremiobacteraeota bacterium]